LLHEPGALHCVSGETGRALREWFLAQFAEEKTPT
jgi:hypothetical protein